jgi:hypothetical protein
MANGRPGAGADTRIDRLTAALGAVFPPILASAQSGGQHSSLTLEIAVVAESDLRARLQQHASVDAHDMRQDDPIEPEIAGRMAGTIHHSRRRTDPVERALRNTSKPPRFLLGSLPGGFESASGESHRNRPVWPGTRWIPLYAAVFFAPWIFRWDH